MEEINKEVTAPSDVQGGGMSVYLGKEICNRFDIGNADDVSITEHIGDGRGEVQLTISKDGVSVEDVKQLAENTESWDVADEWTVTDYYEDGDETYLTVTTDNETVIRIDDVYHIDGKLVNNVVIETSPINITECPTVVSELSETVEDERVRMVIRDSEGLWQRLHHSTNRNIENREQTVEQIASSATVIVSFKFTENSIYLSTTDILQAVSKLETAGKEAKKIMKNR